MAASAAALVRDASTTDESGGTVRISCSEIVGGMVMPQILAQLREAHPRLQIELVLSNQDDDILRRDADLAVRMANPTQGALHGRKIGVIDLGLFASKSYVQKHGRPMSLDERRGHTFIGFDHRPPYADRVISDLPITRELFDIRTDNDFAHLALIQAGVGIGACQLALASRLGLVPVLPDAFRFSMETWIITHEDLRQSRRIRMVFDALVAGFQSYLGE